MLNLFQHPQNDETLKQVQGDKPLVTQHYFKAFR